MGYAAPHDEVSGECELVAAVNAGDAAAFERLFRDWYEPLCRFADFLLGDAEVARDAVADVFASIWRRRAEWRPAHGIAAYLFGAVRSRELPNGTDTLDAGARSTTQTLTWSFSGGTDDPVIPFFSFAILGGAP